MDEELKAKLLTYLNDVEAAAKTGKDFLIEQAPLYVQELLAWEFWSNAVVASILGLAIFAVVFWAMWNAKSIKACLAKAADDCDPPPSFSQPACRLSFSLPLRRSPSRAKGR